MAYHFETDPTVPESAALPETESRREPAVAVGAPTFLVTAYRWGCTNEHAYHVYAGIDRLKALAMARAEQADRGGKYACVVWEFDADGAEYKSIAYYGSQLCPDDARVPRHNHRIDYFERIGQFVDMASTGKALLPDPKNPRHLNFQAVTPLPDYLQREIQRQREFMSFWQDETKQPTN